MRFQNNYFIMRHGQAVSNVEQISSCWPEKFYNPLTPHGIEKVKESAEELKKHNIDLIFCSPLLRTRLTAEIVGRVLGTKPKVDERLKEQGSGIYNGFPFMRLNEFFGEKSLRRFRLKPQNGESYIEIKNRMVACLKDIDKKHKGKNILIVSHELPLLFLECAVKGISNKDFYLKREKINTAQVRKLYAIQLPGNRK